MRSRLKSSVNARRVLEITIDACLVALATGAAPAIEATIAFGLVLAAGLELQARRSVAQPVPVRTTDGSGGLSPAGTRGAGRRATPRHSRRR